MAAGAAALAVGAERARPPLPKITAPVTFDTPEADPILEALQVFPPDDSRGTRTSAGCLSRPTRRRWSPDIHLAKNLDYNLDMGFIIVPPDQKRVEVKPLEYPQDSDPGPYPVPDNTPIENWPLAVNEDQGP